MKLMKKVSAILLLGLIVLGIVQPSIFGTTVVTELGGARYYIEERKEENELPYGVMHYRDLAMSSTNASSIVYASGWSADTTELFVPNQYYPQQINVLEVPTTSNAKIVSWAMLNNHKWSLATVRMLAMDYESKNPGWKVIAAINGDFFDIGGSGNMPYQTIGAVTNDGENYRTTTGGVTNVGFTNDGSTNTLIGYKQLERSTTMKLSVYNEQDEIIQVFDVEKVNQLPNDGETAVFFGTYNASKEYVPIVIEQNSGSTFFVDQAQLALSNTTTDFYGRGFVTSTEPKAVNFGQFAIVSKNPDVNNQVQTGVKIRVQWDIVGDYANATAISGAGHQFLKDGEYTSLVDHRHPRTVVGVKEDGSIVMMVVDGRQASKGMHGAHGSELAAMMAHYGVVEAYNLDGGGSSTLLVREGGEFVVKNSPSDGRERTDSNAILIVALDPEIQHELSDITQSTFTMKSQVTTLNGHDVQELYIKINNQLHRADVAPITLENLSSNTAYQYQYYYKDSNNNMVKLITQGSVRTYRTIPKLIFLHIQETDTSFILTIEYDDPDRATDFSRALIGVAGKSTTLWNGTSTINKSVLPEIWGLYVQYSYNIGDGKNIVVRIHNPHYRATMALNEIIMEQNDQIKSIYR